MKRTSVLLVESDEGLREQLGSWLESGGFDVLECPGPGAPDYVCVGGREGACPLVEPAGAVVLACRLDSDEVLQGTPAEEVLALYVAAGKPVVCLGRRESTLDRFAGEPVVSLPRRPERTELLAALRKVTGRHQNGRLVSERDHDVDGRPRLG